ncbi:oxidoreductase domain protein [Nocardia phage P3.1]|nr:oxidoreductase domain protein [Nocardia phage P3.1]
MKRVAILGCGPAGLLAAHAAVQNGCDIKIFSKKRPSLLFGCQYLHQPVFGIGTNLIPKEVSYVLTGGTLHDYRLKVYGEDWNGKVSPGTLEGAHLAWDIREAYQELWGMYNECIQDAEFKSASQTVQDYELEKFDVVISTVPRKIWAEPGDKFLSTKVWAIGDAPELGQVAPFSPREDFTVICDASKDVGWYRMSRVFGHTTIEWPGIGRKPPISGVVQVEKPLSFQSTMDTGFIHLGRYGAWMKGVLTTDAYNMAKVVTA